MNKQVNEDYDELLNFIAGRGKWRLFGGGITTYPNSGEDRNDRLHAGCLELEQRGEIYRFNEGEGWVIWKVAEGKE